MNASQCAHDMAIRRRQTVFVLTFLFTVISFSFLSGPAWSVELDQPSSVIDTGDTTLPIISAPSPVQASEDSCLPLLKSARYLNSPSSAMDRDRHSAGKAAAIGLIFGVRFALGPEEVTKSKRRGKSMQFDVWQTRNESGARALAIAEYRRCKNDQALKAISDWRWAR